MRLSSALVAGVTLLAGSIQGCGGAPTTELPETVDFEALSAIPGDQLFHEWMKIFSVEADGTAKRRQLVGYLDRRFSHEDVDGKYFVLDRKHDERGFLLASARAFVLEERDGRLTARDLGNVGLEQGIKRILESPGAIELERVAAASTSPDSPAGGGEAGT